MGKLDGQHIFVTGGAQGIGAAVVSKCIFEGASVSFMDLRGKSHDTALFIEGNVCKADDIARAHQLAKAKSGPVTGLVNNAGRNSYADPVKMTEAEWDDVFAVDLKAAWMLARQMLPDMIAAKRGSIVNVSSIHADMTYPGYFPYAAAKSGLIGLTRSLALEVGPHQVRVNALSPGYTETALVQEFFSMNDPGLRQKVIDVHPMGRMAKPSEIANCIAFLLSDEASFVTGANWRVDGGLTSRFAG